jgi:hypothetical protein
MKHFLLSAACLIALTTSVLPKMRHPLRRQDRLRPRDLERLRPQVPRVSFDRLRHRLQA